MRWAGVNLPFIGKVLVISAVNKGPFQSTKKLIELVKINKNYHVLDVACGTPKDRDEVNKRDVCECDG